MRPNELSGKNAALLHPRPVQVRTEGAKDARKVAKRLRFNAENARFTYC